MTASGTMARNAAAISRLRAITPASGVGICIRRLCHCARSDAISRPQPLQLSRLPRRLLAPRNDANASALARLEARVGLVDDKDAAAPAHDAAVLVALFQRLQRIDDLHLKPSSRAGNIGTARVEVKPVQPLFRRLHPLRPAQIGAVVAAGEKRF